MENYSIIIDKSACHPEIEQYYQIQCYLENYQYLKENSYWIKFLNRDPALYKEFESKMKELYKERPTDKISEAIDGIDMISGILTSLKFWVSVKKIVDKKKSEKVDSFFWFLIEK